MAPDGARLNISFERRAIIQKNGDIDELLSLAIENIGCAPYRFIEHASWVCFYITDSPAECVTAYDSAESNQWLSERTLHGFVVGTQPLADLAPGDTRSFGAHIHRRGRLIPSEHEMNFSDPFLFSRMDRTHIERDTYRVVVIFPDRDEGWTLSTPLPDGDLTSRTVTWDFAYDEQGTKQLSVTAKASALNRSMLLYDDILAELHMLIGRAACAHPFDDTALRRRIRHAGRGPIQEITAPLLGISELNWPDRLLRLRAIQGEMVAERGSVAHSMSGGGSSPPLQQGGVPAEDHASVRGAARPDAVGPSQHVNGQQVAQSSIGGNLTQITNVFCATSAFEETSIRLVRRNHGEESPMSKTKTGTLGQVIEDASSGGKITQQSDASSDAQKIAQVEAAGDIVQKKSAAAQMSFSFGGATGAGVITLTVAFLAWLVYKYITHQ